MENKTVLNDISGGPGSGKVSHSERLSQELISNGILHLNVTELLKDIFRLNGEWRTAARGGLLGFFGGL